MIKKNWKRSRYAMSETEQLRCKLVFSSLIWTIYAHGMNPLTEVTVSINAHSLNPLTWVTISMHTVKIYQQGLQYPLTVVTVSTLCCSWLKRITFRCSCMFIDYYLIVTTHITIICAYIIMAWKKNNLVMKPSYSWQLWTTVTLSSAKCENCMSN